LLSPLCEVLLNDLRAELRSQGHTATGTLMDSLRVEIMDELGGLKIVGSSVFYGRYVDSGREPGVKRVPLDALIEWIRVKRFDLQGRSERSVAFLIQRAIFERGIPTDGNEMKRMFVRRTLENRAEYIRAFIFEKLDEVIRFTLTESIKNTEMVMVK